MRGYLIVLRYYYIIIIIYAFYIIPTYVLLTAVGQTYKTRADFRTKRFVNKIVLTFCIIIL